MGEAKPSGMSTMPRAEGLAGWSGVMALGVNRLVIGVGDAPAGGASLGVGDAVGDAVVVEESDTPTDEALFTVRLAPETEVKESIPPGMTTLVSRVLPVWY